MEPITSSNISIVKKTILIAYSSKTMCEMISSILSEMGYTVITAADGVKALQLIFTKKIDCVIAHVELDRISGYALCRIVKNTPFFKNIAFILSNTENKTQFRYWSLNSRADAFYTVQMSSNEQLQKDIEKAIAFCSNLPEEKTNLNRKDVFEILTQAFDTDLFNLYLKDNAYTSICLINDIPLLLKRILDNLTGVIDYDIAAIILNSDPLTERYVVKNSISSVDLEDFKKICHSDFENYITNRKSFLWNESVCEIDNSSAEEESVNKIKDYQLYPSDKDKNYVFTLHIASFNENTFNQRTIQRLNYFAETYSLLLENAILLDKSIKAEAKMRTSFSRFLPDKVIKDIIANRTAVTNTMVGENRKVAVLIADIRSFTSISEMNSPEDVVSFLNYFFEKMGAIIKKHGGTIDKFMGDAIMALFGAPDSYPDNGLRAANAALEMRQTLIDTSMIHLSENYKFDYGIGIHYGSMIVGTIGSTDKKDYTVIGDNVNLASRVEGLTKIFGSQIIITEDVKKDIDTFSNRTNEEMCDENSIEHSTRNLGLVKVKGKTKPVRIFEISPNVSKYNDSFLEKYDKGLDRYIDGDFSGALDYFTEAAEENPSDLASKYCIKQCNKFIESGKDENWDGSFKLLEK